MSEPFTMGSEDVHTAVDRLQQHARQREWDGRPWLLVPGLKSALVAALATGAIATVNSTIWVLAGSLAWWRLLVAMIASIALVVGWIVTDGELWDRPDGDCEQAKERSRLYNTSTLLT